MTRTTFFQRNETINTYLDVLSGGILVAPSSVPTISVWLPDGTLLVDEVSMTNYATGRYSYQLVTDSTTVPNSDPVEYVWPVGWYPIRKTVIDTETTIVDDGFDLAE